MPDHELKKVIGIDLTGAEKRASGIALLWENGQVRTKRLKTDEEIVAEVLAAKPDLISIDSPLSLPEDPTKIYRECELTLKRRGIGVYWCLLPSMKALTMRGIALAARLRDEGFKVIESYPGAAQDILGTPGKARESKRWPRPSLNMVLRETWPFHMTNWMPSLLPLWGSFT